MTLDVRQNKSSTINPVGKIHITLFLLYLMNQECDTGQVVVYTRLPPTFRVLEYFPAVMVQTRHPQTTFYFPVIPKNTELYRVERGTESE